MTAACTALLACRATPALAPGLARLMFLLPLFAAHLPVFATPVSCPATSRELYQPILPYRFINVRIDDGLPFARTCALTDRVALRGILTGTPSTHGAYWRTTMFDAWTADIPDSELPARLRVNQTLCYMVALPRSGHSSADTSFPHDISVSRFTPNELTLCVTTAKPALLIYADCWHPRWHVTIAGHEQPLLRYDGIFKCVVIPAGTSTVSFAFRHPAFTAALLAAHATLALLTILTLLAFVRQKRAIDNSTPPMYHRFIA